MLVLILSVLGVAAVIAGLSYYLTPDNPPENLANYFGRVILFTIIGAVAYFLVVGILFA